MGLKIVTAIHPIRGRQALWRGRLVNIENATLYTSPSAAQRAMDSAKKQYDRSTVDKVTGWQVEPYQQKGE